MKIVRCAMAPHHKRSTLLYRATFSETDISRATYSARRFPDRVHYDIHRCDDCGLVFSSPIFEPSIIAGFYKESSCDYTNLIPYVSKTYLDLYDSFRDRLPSRPRILEVGCANGFFIHILKEHRHADVYGVEPGKTMVDNAPKDLQKKIIKDILRSNQYQKNYFDAVFAFHVLDHIVELNECIRTMYEITKKGGLVCIVVHDTQGLSVKVLGERSPIFDIEHIYLFNKKNLVQIFEKHNFKPLRVVNLANRYPLSYWIRMCNLPKHIGSFFGGLIEKIGISNIPMSLEAGNIVLLAQKI